MKATGDFIILPVTSDGSPIRAVHGRGSMVHQPVRKLITRKGPKRASCMQRTPTKGTDGVPEAAYRQGFANIPTTPPINIPLCRSSILPTSDMARPDLRKALVPFQVSTSTKGIFLLT